MTSSTRPTPALSDGLCLIRGRFVILHPDLARLCGVPSARLLELAHDFPGDFCFPLEPVEVLELTGEPWNPREPLQAFSEHGALLAASHLGTPESLQVAIQLAQAFIRRRESDRARSRLAGSHWQWREEP